MVAERAVTEARAAPLPGGYGWYYFDGISLDGRYVVVATWYSGFIFSPRYYDEVLELREREGAQPAEGTNLADPTEFGAFGLGLYDRGRTVAYVVVETPLVRSGSDPWFPNLHSGRQGIGSPSPPPADSSLVVGENRLSMNPDGSYDLEFSDRSKWLRTVVKGRLNVRPLAGGSDIVPLGTEGDSGMEGTHEWQILASRAEVTGRISWSGPIDRRVKSLDLQALGYVDRNVGRLPISVNVGCWLWGRFQGSERTIAYYRLDPADAPLGRRAGGGAEGEGPSPTHHYLFYGDRSGGRLVEGGKIEIERVRRNRWGMRHPLAIRGVVDEMEWRAEVARDVDRGPFYVRCLSRLNCPDEALDGVVGITECFLPARWDVPLYRLFSKGRIRRGP
ncbi:MAG: hypothetical protein FJY88_07190 [Candidatus Eisenbacteria bacterium]|nr:hypothetical protein [Candidatus Eisenbacteria bacterium]